MQISFSITSSLTLTKVLCLFGFFLPLSFMFVFVRLSFTICVGEHYSLSYEPLSVCLFLPAHVSGVFYFINFSFFFNWTAPFSDPQLLSFFSTAPVWYLFIVYYIIIFYFTYLGLASSWLIFILFLSAQFFFINSGFCTEWVLFYPTTNPLLSDSLNYIHPPIVNSLYVVSFLFLFLSFKYLLFAPTVRVILLLFLWCLRQFSQLLTYLVIALFFGLFWAMQLDTWGGWWVWDPSETLLLQFVGAIILGLHSCSSYFFFSWLSLLYCFCFYYIIAWGCVFIYQAPTLHTFTSAYSFFLSNYLFCIIFLSYFLFLRSWSFNQTKQQPLLTFFSKYTFSLALIFLGFIYSNWSFFTLPLFYFLVIFTYSCFFRWSFWLFLLHLLVSCTLVYCLLVTNPLIFPKIILMENYWVFRFYCLVGFISVSDLFLSYLQPLTVEQSISTIFINTEGRLTNAVVNYRFWV
uniref:Heme lyase n=1 Tax=Moneuplotes minuta TaxID=74792 RepID=D1LDM9_9SPIT|nr:heme lyase [Moneuplotes minuta]